ncbi:Oidioi.mRNA.OKI2018_I69.chr2.g4566.t1.cds [Oikopleura dioica]|uniref:Oidioi.mRNA.OKI2018_I69.chr2.g4566.t1.cds n=1 Tax=Oikopleura dioica TaxID=34765 RepID=A0ABN7T209_OIKDI|nr:Oidioi.mRNA.OKI2018_I69.chr2.g4566.t1.cds [Oikopleura dioica]
MAMYAAASCSSICSARYASTSGQKLHLSDRRKDEFLMVQGQTEMSIESLMPEIEVSDRRISMKKIGTRLKDQILCRKSKKAKNLSKESNSQAIVIEFGTPRERSSARLKSARLEFAKEMNKSLADESRLDDLLDAIIFAEQEVLHHERESFRKFLIASRTRQSSLQSVTKQLDIPKIPSNNHLCVNQNARLQ